MRDSDDPPTEPIDRPDDPIDGPDARAGDRDRAVDDAPGARFGARPWSIIGLAILVIPLLCGGLWAAVGPTPGDDADPRPAGGPLASALSDASAEGSFARAGSTALQDGTGELAEGADQLSAGAAELAAGMEELQAGIGQAGTGAQELSGGVDELVGGVRGAAVVQGQLSTAIDDAIGRLEGDEPPVADARGVLEGLRDQLAEQGLDQNTLGRLDGLRDGAGELARQLGSPGAPLYDGVYQATDGARELSEGADQLASGAGEANDGAERVAGSVGRTGDAVERARAAYIAESGEVAMAADEELAERERRVSMTVLAVAATALLGGLVLWLARRPGIGSQWATVPAVALVAAGPAAWAVTLTSDRGAGAAVAAVLVVTLTAVTGALLWRALLSVFGIVVGRIVGVVFAAAQVALVWWVWVTGGVGATGTALASATPLGQATGALDVIVTNGPDGIAVAAGLILAALAGCSAAVIVLTERRRDEVELPEQRRDEVVV